MTVGLRHVLEHLVVAGDVEHAVEDRDFDGRAGLVGERHHGVGELGVLVPAEVGQELRLADHVLAVEAADEVQTLVASVPEVCGRERLQLGISAAKDRIAGRRQHLRTRDRHYPERAGVEPAAEQRPDLAVGFLRLGAALVELRQADLIEAAT